MTPAEAFAVLGLRHDAAWDDVRRAYRTLMRDHHPDRAGPTHAGAAAVVTEAFAVLRASRTTGQLAPSPRVESAAAGRSKRAARPGPAASTEHPETSSEGPARSSAGSARFAAGASNAARGSPGSRAAGAPSDPLSAAGARPSAAERHAGAEASTAADARGGPVRLLADDTISIDGSMEEAFLLVLEAANDAGEVTYIDPDIGLLETIVSFPGTPVTSLVVTLQARADRIEAFCTVEALDGSAPPSLAAVVEALADLARRRIGQPAPHPVRAPREWLTDAD